MRLAELLRRASQTLTADYVANYYDGLTMPQIALLDAIGTAPGPISRLEVSERASIDRSTAAVMLCGLTNAGLIIRTKLSVSKHGPRPSGFQLSRRGARKLERSQSALAVAEGKIMRDVPLGARSEFLVLLEKIAFSGKKN